MEQPHIQTQGPKSGEKPRQLVMLLHGLGSNGRDLIGLAQYWGEALPHAVFVSPDAPFPCDMALGMVESYQWFSLQSFDPQDMLRGVQEAAPILESYINKTLEAYDLKGENCALVGFSQGTMMSLYSGPRRKEKLAGILGYSGALLGADGLSAPDIQKPPIHLIHGEADEVVPVAAYHHARENLQNAGFTVTGHTTPGLGHSIDNDGLESGIKFLTSVFA